MGVINTGEKLFTGVNDTGDKTSGPCSAEGLVYTTVACAAPVRIYTTGAWAVPGIILTTGDCATSGRI